VRISNERLVITLMPEREREHPHERAVAVCLLVGRARNRRRDTAHHRPDRPRGLDTHVEHMIVDCEVSAFVPSDEAPPEVVEIELSAIEQRGEEAQRLGTVVTPGRGRNTSVRPPKPNGRCHLDEVASWDLIASVELIRHTERITDESPDEGPLDARSTLCHEDGT
jgi:hypothetical protein